LSKSKSLYKTPGRKLTSSEFNNSEIGKPWRFSNAAIQTFGNHRNEEISFSFWVKPIILLGSSKVQKLCLHRILMLPNAARSGAATRTNHPLAHM
jgi:hypothetical protein